MDILSDASTLANGGFAVFSAIVLFRISTIEKNIERRERTFVDFKNEEDETNKETERRLSRIEMYLARFNTFNKQ
ncbi:hypothetical protein Xen7305DRAFT_00045430 [Xenococcus sp. PCC 7305]|uniref:hypothetical protein n=1 Tax=Xenococcus sp. PCC 7305 TaxID=102125 RepID=UPI0002ABC018|nr:hypothetical protein [Xenococcus sp. PCC 7305]ELS04807.1 hypothetical protein Xen7305DRAFT_00045430 [Xenococcus sp. PCC 7305]